MYYFTLSYFILEYFLSIQHGGEINIFDVRRGKINFLNGVIKGLPKRSPFIKTDCTLKLNKAIYVVGALKGETELGLYKSDPSNQGKFENLYHIFL